MACRILHIHTDLSSLRVLSAKCQKTRVKAVPITTIWPPKRARTTNYATPRMAPPIQSLATSNLSSAARHRLSIRTWRSIMLIPLCPPFSRSSKRRAASKCSCLSWAVNNWCKRLRASLMEVEHRRTPRTWPRSTQQRRTSPSLTNCQRTKNSIFRHTQ